MTPEEKRKQKVMDYAANCSVWESSVIDTLMEEIQDAINEEGIPEEYHEEVFNIINNRCTIRVY